MRKQSPEQRLQYQSANEKRSYKQHELYNTKVKKWVKHYRLSPIYYHLSIPYCNS